VVFFLDILNNVRKKSLAEIVYLTKERLVELEKELKELKTDGRKKMAERIAEARSYGDLSENAEYDAAKDAQGMLELKISKMEEMLTKARVIDLTNMPKDSIHILSEITVKNLKINKTFTYTLVSPEEADLKQSKISITSPVGQAFMGKKAGDIVEANVPAGVIKFEILSLNN
jgi:transcription elongation factor GreA